MCVRKEKEMKKKKIFIFIISCLLINFGIFIFNSEAASRVKLNKTDITIQVGEAYRLKVQGTKKKVKWNTSNKKVVIVNSKGIVTGKKAGTAKVSAAIGNKKYYCKVTVKKEEIPFFAFESKMTIGKKGVANIIYGGYATITYHISNTNILSAKWEKGWNGDATKLYLYGLKSGTTKVTITNAEDNRKIVITVKVDLHPKKVVISKTSAQIFIGNTLKLKAQVKPSYATNKKVNWSSSNSCLLIKQPFAIPNFCLLSLRPKIGTKTKE